MQIAGSMGAARYLEYGQSVKIAGSMGDERCLHYSKAASGFLRLVSRLGLLNDSSLRSVSWCGLLNEGLAECKQTKII